MQPVTRHQCILCATHCLCRLRQHVLLMLLRLQYGTCLLLLAAALPLPSAPTRVTYAAPVAIRHLFAPPRCRIAQYRRTFVFLLVSLWFDLNNLMFDGAGLLVFKSRVNAFSLAYSACSFCLPLFFLFLLPLVGYVGLGASD